MSYYHWPGNIRELENVVERALIQNRGLAESVPAVFESSGLSKRRGNDTLNSKQGAFTRLDDAIPMHIRRALVMTKGKIYGSDGAAGLLGINPSTLRSKMKKLGIPSKRQVLWR